MQTDAIIHVHAFGKEIGKLGYDPDQRKSFFQCHPDWLNNPAYSRMFPYIFRRTSPVQVFSQFEGETFRGLPPMIADSLPDTFGNILFREWFETRNESLRKITPLELLTYVSNRGMGALEYQPGKIFHSSDRIDLEEIMEVLQTVLKLKNTTTGDSLNEVALLNVFKIGTSAGGARPKILISEHRENGTIIPGDITSSEAYNHYLVKLCLDENAGYNKEKVEYAYYRIAQRSGIHMMSSKLIADKHFATLRYDRQHGEKQHVLTVSGLTGWDFKKPENSSYENLFRLAIDLDVPHKDIQELYRRMVFNLVFANTDDHLKNHSFMYLPESDSWQLAPAYDLTYPLNALQNYLRVSRALSINNKRANIIVEDILDLAESFSVKNPAGIIHEIQESTSLWVSEANGLEIPKPVIDAIQQSFTYFL